MENRFWNKVDKTESCWLWTASKDSAGYGHFWKGEKGVKAHRHSWLLAGNTIPEGHIIRHKCRSRNCVRPEHLETGTYAENCADMLRDGTQPDRRGEKSPSAKLTEAQVLAIRARANEKQRLLGEEFGVGQDTISLIILRRTWKHI